MTDPDPFALLFLRRLEWQLCMRRFVRQVFCPLDWRWRLVDLALNSTVQDLRAMGLQGEVERMMEGQC